MVFVFIFGIICLMVSGFAVAETKYLTGKIERIETCKNSGGVVYIYVKDISGTTPTASNGCSNDLVLPYLRLTSENGTVTEYEKIMLSIALTAQTAEKQVRIRFSDTTNTLVSLAID